MSQAAQATELYQRTILDHNKSPRCYGELVGATHSAKGYNPICGDVVHVSLKMNDQNISTMQFTAQSCALCKASASIMCECLGTMSRSDATSAVHNFIQMLDGENVDVLASLAFFSVVRDFPARAKCVMLPWKTLQGVLAAKE